MIHNEKYAAGKRMEKILWGNMKRFQSLLKKNKVQSKLYILCKITGKIKMQISMFLHLHKKTRRIYKKIV